MKERSPRNRTLSCTKEEIELLSGDLLHVSNQSNRLLLNTVIQQDFSEVLQYFPDSFVDLLILDPPYNLSKNYNGGVFSRMSDEDYCEWFDNMLLKLRHVLKETATVYVCADWRTSVLIAPILERYFCVRNRITWEREKGRGAKSNWKNNTEDIWFCTVGKNYFFDVDRVKVKRKVLAPYKDASGKAKDWNEESDGNFRFTYPSNIWTDITVPFWSMPENTDHPTQKPEKAIAKLVLASSKEGDVVLDPFLGSGTTAVVCKKLNRKYIGIEPNLEYCCWSLKRLSLVGVDPSIQGYVDGVFWERNSGK